MAHETLTLTRDCPRVPVAPLLRHLGACVDAIQWVGDRDLLAAWQDCERADWMLWLAGKMCDQSGWPTRRQVVLAACACAERALIYVPLGEERPRLAIETARRWARGDVNVTLARVRAADAADAAYAYAAYAAYAAAAARKAALREMADLLRQPQTWR